MDYDPDSLCDKRDKFKELDRLLSQLDDCDLVAWDRDFVDDMIKRLGRFKERTNVSGSQWEQLERMRRKYGIKED